MTTGENIRNARKALRLTQAELADKIHVARQTVSLWERGEMKPGSDTIKVLAECLKISADALFGVDTKKAAPEGAAPDVEEFRMNGEPIEVPVLSRQAMASCGGVSSYVEDGSEIVEKYITLSRAELGGVLQQERMPYIIISSGDCMASARILDGDMLIINPALSWRPWDICLFWWQGGLGLKKLVPQEDGSIDLHSDHGITNVPAGDIESDFFRVLGKCVNGIYPMQHGI